MKDKIREVKEEALASIAGAPATPEALEALRIKYLGKKGIVAELFNDLAALPQEEKPAAGQLLNSLKNSISKALDERLGSSAILEEEPKERLDVTMPGIRAGVGRIHPITSAINEICAIFIGLGFRVVEGPEIETEH